MRFVNTVYVVNAVWLQAEICLCLFISNLQHHKSNIDRLPLHAFKNDYEHFKGKADSLAKNPNH